MSIKHPNLPFTAPLVAAAPETSGVFALWQDGAIVYYGKASSGGATIRSALDAHLCGRSFQSERPTRCSWEIADDPEPRYRELIAEFEHAHQRAPRWNDPERLPTS
ncbi:MAG TPA: hypothetical protein VGI18_03295 [Burkholderiales bacterium]|jgi:hypothetical protein